MHTVSMHFQANIYDVLSSQSIQVGVVPHYYGVGLEGRDFGKRQPKTIAIVCGWCHSPKISIRVRSLCRISRSRRCDKYTVGTVTVLQAYIPGFMASYCPKTFCIVVDYKDYILFYIAQAVSVKHLCSCACESKVISNYISLFRHFLIGLSDFPILVTSLSPYSPVSGGRVK